MIEKIFWRTYARDTKIAFIFLGSEIFLCVSYHTMRVKTRRLKKLKGKIFWRSAASIKACKKILLRKKNFLFINHRSEIYSPDRIARCSENLIA